MKKMLKNIEMILFIATIIFAAGCADNNEAGNEKVTPEEAPSSASTPSETPTEISIGGTNGYNVTPTPAETYGGGGSAFNVTMAPTETSYSSQNFGSFLFLISNLKSQKLGK